MVGTPERETERSGSRSRRLHNFILPSHLRWGHQKQVRYVRSTQSCTFRNFPALSANVHSEQSRSPITVSRQSPTTSVTSPATLLRASKRKSTIDSSSSDGSTQEVDSICQQLMSDLQVDGDAMNLDFPENKGKGKVEEQKPVEPVIRGGVGSKTYESGDDMWPMRRNDWGYESLLVSNNLEASGENEPERNRFSLALSKSEVESDFLLMTGAKPPQRPKKRMKPIQEQINGLFPGTCLTDVSPETYKINEMPELKDK